MSTRDWMTTPESAIRTTVEMAADSVAGKVGVLDCTTAEWEHPGPIARRLSTLAARADAIAAWPNTSSALAHALVLGVGR